MKPTLAKSFTIAAILFLVVPGYHICWTIYRLIAISNTTHTQISNSIFNYGWVINSLFDITGIIAAILFLSGNYRAARWMRLLSCAYFFQVAFSLLVVLSEYFVFTQGRLNFTIPWFYFPVILIDLSILTYAGITFGGLFEPAFEKVIISGEPVQSNAIFTKSEKRFLNRLTDFTMLVLLLFSQLPYLRMLSRTWSIYVIEISVTFLYYVLTETVFKTTPGKILTGSTVVNSNGEKPGFLTMLGRSFCRFIPFDAFSFLRKDARGWHDSIPDVYVVEEKLITAAETNET